MKTAHGEGVRPADVPFFAQIYKMYLKKAVNKKTILFIPVFYVTI